ncbi:MAG: glycosyltransferase family 4 protein [Nitrospirae bacterium]|nr:glycosyltransferase family 4 protein [Nitrospirota bacterium]
MNILVITSRDLEKASTKFRIVQYRDYLSTKGIYLQFIKQKDIGPAILKQLQDFDMVFNQKCLLRSSLSREILAGGPKTLFDFDDAIYTRPGPPRSFIAAWRVRRRLHLWLREADIVTTANRFLADYARQYSSSVVLVPMAIDTGIWKPTAKKESSQITIGWAGAPVNIPNIERIGPALCVLLKKYPSLRLAVFSGKKPSLPCPFEFHQFMPGAEPAFVQNLDIGLLPLPDEEYSKGKSPIKAIQYLACGVPVVGNVQGATAEILKQNNSIRVSSQDDWINALEVLIHDRNLRRSLGEEGRQLILDQHSIYTVREQLLELFLMKKTGQAAG